MAQLGAKSHWYDTKTQSMCEKPNSIKLFNRIAPRFRKLLPYFARNRWTGDVAWHRTRVRHSMGVVDWVRKGGRINQWGVANIDYTIDEAFEQAGGAETAIRKK